MPRCRGIDIEELSISQIQDYLSKATFTSKDLTQCYLKRIELLNPRLKAVIETNPDALDIADKLDQERLNGNVRTISNYVSVGRRPSLRAPGFSAASPSIL